MCQVLQSKAKLSIRVNAADSTRVVSVNTNVGGLRQMTRPMVGHVPSHASLFHPFLLQNTPLSPADTDTAVNTARIELVRPPYGGAESVICVIE